MHTLILTALLAASGDSMLVSPGPATSIPWPATWACTPALYDGSMSEWSRKTELPVVTGATPR